MKNDLLPYGVIFDMDGVLVDSEEFICTAACMMFDELGLKVQAADFLAFVGTGENRYLGGVAEKYGFALEIEKAKKRTYDIYLQIIKGHLKPLAGVYEFIDKCLKAGKLLAIASSADRRKVEGNIAEIGLKKEFFKTIVTGEDVVNKKPDPEIFLLAAKRLGLNPKDCLVIEDAVSGVAAAKSAGAKCLALTTSFNQEQLKAADFFAANLANAPQQAIEWK